MIEEELWEFVEVLNIILGTSVLVLALMIMRLMPKVDMNLLQAMIFLKKGFLKRTWLLFFLSVLFFVVHEWVIAIPELTEEHGIIQELTEGGHEEAGASEWYEVEECLEELTKGEHEEAEVCLETLVEEHEEAGASEWYEVEECLEELTKGEHKEAEVCLETLVEEHESTGGGLEERHEEGEWKHRESGEGLLYAVLELAYIICLLLITNLWYGLVKECYRDKK